MDFSGEYIQSLIDNPTESLVVELKRWIDPTSEEGIAKIAKACIAMRNNNGGTVVIGFDNVTGKPDPSRPEDVRRLFHFDDIQAIVSKYSSELFEVAVKFGKREDQEYPVICVPSGVRTPVSAKSGLKSADGTRAVKEHQVYVRSLSANGTASTTEPRPHDWAKLVEICMDNREVDIARFVRRHLTSADAEKMRQLLLGLPVNTVSDSPSPNTAATVTAVDKQQQSTPKVDGKTEVLKILDEGAKRFSFVVEERSIQLPKHGTFEAGIYIGGQFPPHSANQTFLNKLLSSNPRLTGWPFWLDSRGFRQEVQGAPYHVEGGWEAFIPFIGPNAMKIWEQTRGHLDFWQMYASGRFYHRRLLEDDAAALTPDDPPKYLPKPNVALDFGLPVLRVYEVLVIGFRFAKTLGCEPTQTTLCFGFRWSGLKERILATWADQSRLLFSHGPTYQDEVISSVAVPLETAESALYQHAHQATVGLYEAFGGFEMPPKFVEDFVAKTFAGRR